MRINETRRACDIHRTRAQAELGIIPRSAGHEIVRKARVKYLDLDAMRAGLRSIGAEAGETLGPGARNRPMSRFADSGFLRIGHCLIPRPRPAVDARSGFTGGNSSTRNTTPRPS